MIMNILVTFVALVSLGSPAIGIPAFEFTFSYEDELCFIEWLYKPSMCCEDFRVWQEKAAPRIAGISDTLAGLKEEIETLASENHENTQRRLINVIQFHSQLAISHKSFQAKLESNTDISEVLEQLGSVFAKLSVDNHRMDERIELISNDLERLLHRNLSLRLSEKQVEKWGEKYFASMDLHTRSVHLREELERVEEEVDEIVKRLESAQQLLRVLQTTTDDLCLPPYTWQGGGCHFVPASAKKTWLEARTFCKGVEGDLAVPADNFQFFHWISALRLKDDFWIGASDRQEEGNWFWVNGEPLDIAGNPFFTSDQPSETRSKDCLKVHRIHPQVIDENCEHEKYFVCQKTMPATKI
ncbi:uncharacterized protein LOC143035131 [Oratosquilla oratoria]|uniref:uncharacterized protein LOC143035131 n=1 Tax=Oratosquilla oratoria TaxID=337810 RepID=UPI003F764F11